VLLLPLYAELNLDDVDEILEAFTP
jgi:hypothetical protein